LPDLSCISPDAEIRAQAKLSSPLRPSRPSRSPFYFFALLIVRFGAKVPDLDQWFPDMAGIYVKAQRHQLSLWIFRFSTMSTESFFRD
jgi:hypothetical protein